MIKQWFGAIKREHDVSSTIYLLGTIFLIIMAIGMIVTALWREITQLTTSTIVDRLPLSNTMFLLVPVFVFVVISMLIGWHLMGQKSFDDNWQIQKHIAKLFWGLAVIALIVIFFYAVWSLSDWRITIWSLPSISSMFLFGSICLLVLQLQVIISGARPWGFSMSGFDFRDMINIFILGFLFFSVSHLVAEYDPLALARSQLPLWFLPIFAIASAVTLSTLSTHIVRIPMATSIAGFFMLSIRNVVFASLSLESLGSSVIPVILGPVFVLDVWHWIKSGQASTLSAAITAAIALFFNYPIFDEWMGITFSGQEYILIIAGSFMVSLGLAWCAKQIGQGIEAFEELHSQLE